MPFNFYNHSVFLSRNGGVSPCHVLPLCHISPIPTDGVEWVASGMQGQSDGRIPTRGCPKSGLF